MLDPFRTILNEVSGDPTLPGGAPAAGEPEPAAPAEEAWTPPTREEWELAEERLSRLELMEQQAQYGQQQPQYAPGEEQGEELELDPFDPNYPQQLRELIRSENEAARNQESQTTEAMERARDVLADVVTRDGEFLNPEASSQRALDLADSLVYDMAQRYGYGPRAAEAAIAKAAQIVRDEEKTIGQAYHDRQVNQVKTLGGAPRQPNVAGSPATTGAAAPSGHGELGLVSDYFSQGSGR